MSRKKDVLLVDVFKAFEKRENIKPIGDPENFITIKSRLGYTPSEADLNSIEKMISQIENSHNVRLALVGGGYGCFKLIFRVSGEKMAIDLGKSLISDADFIQFAKDLALEVVIDQQKIHRIHNKGRSQEVKSGNGEYISASGTVTSLDDDIE